MKPVITVGGIDGAGKSSFARRLQEEYERAGLPVLVLHIDDFRRPVVWQRPDKSEADIYGEEYFDFAAIATCLIALEAGHSVVRRPVFDSRTERATGFAEVRLAGVRAAIVEGVFTMRLPGAAEHFRIWLESSFELGRARMLSRGDPPGRTPEDWAHRIDQRYFPAQERYLALHSPEERADVVIDNHDWQAPRLVRAELARLPKAFRRPLERALPRKATSSPSP